MSGICWAVSKYRRSDRFRFAIKRFFKRSKIFSARFVMRIFRIFTSAAKKIGKIFAFRLPYLTRGTRGHEGLSCRGQWCVQHSDTEGQMLSIWHSPPGDRHGRPFGGSHRGMSGVWPERSCPSFCSAVVFCGLYGQSVAPSVTETTCTRGRRSAAQEVACESITQPMEKNLLRRGTARPGTKRKTTAAGGSILQTATRTARTAATAHDHRDRRRGS